MLPYLIVPHVSARVRLISTRVSAHCQAILLKPDFPNLEHLSTVKVPIDLGID